MCLEIVPARIQLVDFVIQSDCLRFTDLPWNFLIVDMQYREFVIAIKAQPLYDVIPKFDNIYRRR